MLDCISFSLLYLIKLIVYIHTVCCIQETDETLTTNAICIFPIISILMLKCRILFLKDTLIQRVIQLISACELTLISNFSNIRHKYFLSRTTLGACDCFSHLPAIIFNSLKSQSGVCHMPHCSVKISLPQTKCFTKFSFN